MNYKEHYVYRLNKKGSSDIDAINYNTKQITNQLFDKSPSYVSLLLNGVDSDGVLSKTKSSLEKEIMFRPDTTINVGDLVEMDSKNYLIVSYKDIDLFPYVTVKLCNSTLTLKGEPIKTQTGTDYRGAPIYEYVDGEPILIPCIAENKLYISDNNQAINLPDNQIKVTIPYTVHNEIAINKVFPMYGNEYKIIGIDKTQSINGVGLMVLTGQFESEVVS